MCVAAVVVVVCVDVVAAVHVVVTRPRVAMGKTGGIGEEGRDDNVFTIKWTMMGRIRAMATGRIGATTTSDGVDNNGNGRQCGRVRVRESEVCHRRGIVRVRESEVKCGRELHAHVVE